MPAANIEILEVINNRCELLKEGLHVVPSLAEASKSESRESLYQEDRQEVDVLKL